MSTVFARLNGAVEAVNTDPNLSREIGREAQNYVQYFAAEGYAMTPYAQAFLAAENVYPLLCYIVHSSSQRRKHLPVQVDYRGLFDRYFVEFASLPSGLVHHNASDLHDINTAFINLKVEPELASDQRLFRHRYELLDRYTRGLDYNLIRRAAYNPSVLGGYGDVDWSSQETRAVGDRQLRTDTYQLSHPYSDGRVRQRRALAVSGYEPSDVVRCTYQYQYQ